MRWTLAIVLRGGVHQSRDLSHCRGVLGLVAVPFLTGVIAVE
jgi:hypothetical protein